MATTKVLVATETFWTEVNGVDKLFIAGLTKIPADHEVAKRASDYFEPVVEVREEVR
jgi:hypothetical protein